VIQELREVIQPYRKVIQKIEPVVEEIQTIVATGQRKPGSIYENVPNAGSYGVFNAELFGNRLQFSGSGGDGKELTLAEAYKKVAKAAKKA
jgi:hypothetical protein